MENVSRIMMFSFSTIMFAAALFITVVMYKDVNTLIERTEQHNSYMSIMAGD